MFSGLQRRIVWFVWAFALFGLLACGARSQTVVVPLVDRSGVTVYRDAVEHAIDGATVSIDVLLSSLDPEENPLVDALVEAQARGAAVRVLIDTSDWSTDIREKGDRAVSELRRLGLDARLDRPDVTTHAKLVIIDRELAILGSTNWNDYAFTDHAQANVLIDDPAIGTAFAEAFDRLWDGRSTAGEAEIDLETAFSAGTAILPLLDADGSALYGRLLLELLPRATRSIHLAMYRMSIYPDYPDSLSNELVAELIAAAGRGVEVQVLLDDCRFYPDSAEANLSSAITLHQRGIEVRLDEPGDTMHAKMLVVDGTSVVLGSTNWNYYSLENNIEANVAFLSVPEVAEAYDAFFRLLWQDGRGLY